MWTDVFMSAGTRTNGGKAGRYLIAGPKWNGTAPKDVTETFRSSTRYAWVLIQMSASQSGGLSGNSCPAGSTHDHAAERVGETIHAAGDGRRSTRTWT